MVCHASALGCLVARGELAARWRGRWSGRHRGRTQGGVGTRMALNPAGPLSLPLALMHALRKLPLSTRFGCMNWPPSETQRFGVDKKAGPLSRGWSWCALRYKGDFDGWRRWGKYEENGDVAVTAMHT
jgi:hypothetical protein